MRETPRLHIKRPPPSFVLCSVKNARGLAGKYLSVGDGAVSEAGKGILYIGKLICGMWIGTYFAQQCQTRTDNRKRFKRSALKMQLSAKEYRARMHRAVVCITARKTC